MERESRTVHTNISFWAVILAICIELYLFIRHPMERFGQLAFFEALFAIAGLIAVDLLRSKETTFSIKKRYGLQPVKGNLLFRTFLIFMGIAVIQILFQLIPLTIPNYEMALAIIFAAPCEEIFFRGLCMEIFFLMGKTSKDKFRLNKKKAISFIEIVGILISAIFFAIFHTNYYNNISIMLSVFFGGILLSFSYWYWKDLTSLILAHFLLNIMAVGQMFFIVNLG